MAINPPSDIVLDVARAADPLQYDAAVQKLARLSPSADIGPSFDSLLGAIDPAADAPTPAPAGPADDWMRADLRDRLTPLATPSEAAVPSPYRQFEAFVLQTFIQSMFPKDASQVFGGGLAGGYWSSMLAEQIGSQVAKSGGIGIAAELQARHPAAAPPVATVPGSADSSASTLSGLHASMASLQLDFADSVMRRSADRNDSLWAGKAA